MKATQRATREHAVIGTEVTVEPASGRATPLKVTSAGPPHRRTSEKIRILIADDHPVFRDGLRRLLETQDDFDVIGEAADGAEAVRLAGELDPDVLLLDLSMPHLSGLDVLDELGRTGLNRKMKTLMLVAGIDKTQRMKSLQLGARGIVLKDTPTHLLVKSIRTVATGSYWVGRETVSDLVQALAQFETADRDVAPQKCSLTPRELQILALVVSGYANKDIAQTCSVSEDTVKHHLTNIFDKTGVSNRLELALFAIHHHLVGNASGSQECLAVRADRSMPRTTTPRT